MVLLGTEPTPPAENEWRKRRVGLGGGAAAVVVLVLLVKAALGSFGGHGYQFLATQGGNPVTWNHCQAIRYQVNPKGAPADWQEIVHAAVKESRTPAGSCSPTAVRRSRPS